MKGLVSEEEEGEEEGKEEEEGESVEGVEVVETVVGAARERAVRARARDFVVTILKDVVLFECRGSLEEEDGGWRMEDRGWMSDRQTNDGN